MISKIAQVTILAALCTWTTAAGAFAQASINVGLDEGRVAVSTSDREAKQLP